MNQNLQLTTTTRLNQWGMSTISSLCLSVAALLNSQPFQEHLSYQLKPEQDDYCGLLAPRSVTILFFLYPYTPHSPRNKVNIWNWSLRLFMSRWVSKLARKSVSYLIEIGRILSRFPAAASLTLWGIHGHGFLRMFAGWCARHAIFFETSKNGNQLDRELATNTPKQSTASLAHVDAP